mmetsp:Transcript_16517/g.35885  ORF Transcript_16517/g.35885 Transcript_16517/m.35885 type:complete len:211 (+) Transcript_16517:1-633(+)
MHLALCLFCAASTLALGSDPVVVLHLVNDASTSKISLVVTLIMLILLLAAPALIFLLLLSLITASTVLERVFYGVQLATYVLFARDVRQFMWRPLMQQHGEYSAIPWTIYFSHAVAFACMMYLCVRGRPVPIAEQVTADVATFVSSVEQTIAPSSKTTTTTQSSNDAKYSTTISTAAAAAGKRDEDLQNSAALDGNIDAETRPAHEGKDE